MPTTDEAFNEYMINANDYSPCPWCGGEWSEPDSKGSRIQPHDEQCPLVLWMEAPDENDEGEQQ